MKAQEVSPKCDIEELTDTELQSICGGAQLNDQLADLQANFGIDVDVDIKVSAGGGGRK